MRRALRTRHEDIVAANDGLLSTLLNVDELDDPRCTCWGCGNSGRGLLTRAQTRVLREFLSGQQLDDFSSSAPTRGTSTS
ncbi:MAG TPA: hypothetical protein VNV25_25220 [Gemmatimonadaceae bacterium]|jgi:hypothetical protein|nr:hypothetical protein [Gemmatimonadaceae bacterium]